MIISCNPVAWVCFMDVVFYNLVRFMHVFIVTVRRSRSLILFLRRVYGVSMDTAHIFIHV